MTTAKHHIQHSSLKIVPKKKSTQHTTSDSKQQLRYLSPQPGIMWHMIPPVFVRYNWMIQEHTEFYLKAHQPQSDQTAIISRMGQGQVIINHNYAMSSASDLHQIEQLAETAPKSNRPKITRKS